MAAGSYFAWVPVDLDRSYENGTQEIDEAASQTFKRGTPVVLDSAGRVAACGTSPSLIYGVACTAGQNGTAGQYKTIVLPLGASGKWRIPLLEALAQNMLGQAGGDLGILVDATTGFWYGSTADAGAQCRVVDWVKPPAGMNIGDTKAPVVVVFHTTKIQVI